MHVISFKKAEFVFFGENPKLISDPDHPENEEEFI